MSQPKALPLLKQLMQIQSTTKQEDAVATFLATHLTQQGWSVSKQPLPQLSADTEPQPARSNVFAYLGPKPTDEKTAGAHTVKVLLNSHLDTVPPYIEYREDETKVYGRGACDAKGSVAVQVQAVTELLEEGKIQQGDVGLLYVVGEETDHVGMLHANNLNISTQYLLVGEPTEMRLARGHKGVVKVDITVNGKAGHSGYPERGRNALKALVDILYNLEHATWPTDPTLGPTTLNIGTVHGGLAANVIAPLATADISFRVSTSAEEVIGQLNKIVAETVVQDGIDVKVVVRAGMNPVRCVTVGVQGVEEFVAAYFTDIPYLKGNHKSLLYGPGSITVAHADHEFVEKSELVEAVRVIKEIVLQLVAKA